MNARHWSATSTSSSNSEETSASSLFAPVTPTPTATLHQLTNEPVVARAPIPEVDQPYRGQPSATNREWLRYSATLDPDTLRRVCTLIGNNKLEDSIAVLHRRMGHTAATTIDTLATFVKPSLKSLPDAWTIKDVPAAVERLYRAVKNNEKIAIFGDYDVDGATSTAIMYRSLTTMSDTHVKPSEPLDVLVYIPDRLTEGYGPTIEAFQKLKDMGATVIVTLDCGTSSPSVIKAGKDMGMDVIVIDHHLPAAGEPLPDAYALVNPNRLDETEQHRSLGVCTAGVAYFIVSALNQRFTQYGTAEVLPSPIPPMTSDGYSAMRHLLDLVALGTIADVMSLEKPVNRTFLQYGRIRNPGMKALASGGGRYEVPLDVLDPQSLGYKLGPPINASSRVGTKPDLAARLLCFDDIDETNIIATQLLQLNTHRQYMERDQLKLVIPLAEQQVRDGHRTIVIGHPSLHLGIIGILAGRIKSKFGLPTIVIAIDNNGIGKGSGRAGHTYDLSTVVQGAVTAGILTKAGGHRAAIGLTMNAEKLPELHAYLEKNLVATHDSKAPVDIGQAPEAEKVIYYDRVWNPSWPNGTMWHFFSSLAPFGYANAFPRIVIDDAEIKQFKPNKGEGMQGWVVRSGNMLKCVAFKRELATILMEQGARIRVYGYLQRTSLPGSATTGIPWGYTFHIEDAALLSHANRTFTTAGTIAAPVDSTLTLTT